MELDGADSSDDNLDKGTAGGGGIRGVGGFESWTSHLLFFEKCIIVKFILYHECSLIHPIANYCVHDSQLHILTWKSKLQSSDHIFALTGGESFALTDG